MTPKQHEAICDAHMMWSVRSAANYLSDAAVYIGMVREDPHWMTDAKRSIEHAKEQLAKFEAELAANMAEPEACMQARAKKRYPAGEAEMAI